jgi:RimJ/RimL family protein N-acetyltransferase
VNIRLLTPADAEAYHALRLRMLREHPAAFTSSFEEEIEKPIAWVQERLLAREAWPAKFVLGSFAPGGTMVGSVGLAVETREKQRHKAVLFGMFTIDEHQGKGVGFALLKACIERAAGIRDLEQVNLTVTDGTGAERLYRSVGFERFGVERRALKFGGAYYDKVHMALRLAGS